MTTDLSGKALSAYAFEESGFILDGTPVFQILERTSTIDYFGDSPARLRGALFRWNGCVAFGIQCAVGQVVQYVYTCWLNYQDRFDRQVYTALEDNQLLVVRVYGSNRQPLRLFVAEHALGALVAEAGSLLQSLPPWTTACFDETIVRVKQQFGMGHDLWRKLGSRSGLLEVA